MLTMNANYYVNLALHEPWAIAPDYAQSYLPLLAQLLKGESGGTGIDHAVERLRNKSYIILPGADGMDDEDLDIPIEDAPAGAIAVLNLKGPIVKNSQYCGPRGTVELAAELKKIYANPNFIGVLLDLDSGGGQAYAVKPLTDVLAERNKPVVILSGNLLCSAGYYIASYGDEIVCDHPRSIIGCIGVMQTMVNTQPALEKMGVEFHNIYATQSSLKNKTFADALKGDYTKLKADLLDPLAEDFIADVKAQRPGISADKTIFQGETFLASKAVDLGMIDYLGNKDFAIARVKSLATNYANPQNPKSNMKFTKIEALAGVESPTDEQLEQANAELTTAGITNATIVPESMITEASAVTAERDGLVTDLATANASLATAITAQTTAETNLETANATIIALNARLAKTPGASHQGAGSADGKDEQPDGSGEDTPDKVIAGLAHNLEAMASL